MQTVDVHENIFELAFNSKISLIARLLLRYARFWMSLTLLVSDFGCLLLTGFFALGLRDLIFGSINYQRYAQMGPVIVLFLGIYFVWGLYPAIGINPVEELRRLSVATSMAFLLLAALTFLAKSPQIYSRAVFIIGWLLALILIPLGRSLMRTMVIRLRLWGEPVAVVGSVELLEEWTAILLKNPKYGLLPVIAFSSVVPVMKTLTGIPVRKIDCIQQICKRENIQAAIVLSKQWGIHDFDILGAHQDTFKRVIFLDAQSNPKSIWMSLVDLGGKVGLEIRNGLTNYGFRILKRLIDMLGAISGLILLTPLMLLLAFLIKLDSPGPVLYWQWRLGKNGKPFKMFKFRTMYFDADCMLEDALEKDALLRGEWDRYQKLRNDPRVTRVGRLLRRFSIDELPQLWNVLKGEMSLVGPRPFFTNQLEDYGNKYQYYILVRPGLTGMWQISGRNKTSFAERADWDQYYVSNWSFWLEVYILARTLWVVFTSDGAF